MSCYQLPDTADLNHFKINKQAIRLSRQDSMWPDVKKKEDESGFDYMVVPAKKKNKSNNQSASNKRFCNHCCCCCCCLSETLGRKTNVAFQRQEMQNESLILKHVSQLIDAFKPLSKK